MPAEVNPPNFHCSVFFVKCVFYGEKKKLSYSNNDAFMNWSSKFCSSLTYFVGLSQLSPLASSQAALFSYLDHLMGSFWNPDSLKIKFSRSATVALSLQVIRKPHS